ncbi:Two component transcriptional regulator, LuxR family [Bosea sp. LC85]|uniref:response regulator n=1 Tax=Bosea sp. LC85 TaxID=1502851 RepID=UPI0004E3D037|nr:response regulator transcription factor [Bosea sp. LC85]KFC64830.1 Two component transcriptional regulator, LuxR family [Bosea sp. LC85]
MRPDGYPMGWDQRTIQPMIRHRLSATPSSSTGSPALRIVLADDHALIREGLKLLISTCDAYETVGEAADGASLLQVLAREPADVVVLDLGMPGLTGLSFIRDLLRAYPRVKILVLTANSEPRTVEAALDAGAAGYLVKGGDLGELFEALAALQRAETYLSPPLRAVLPQGGQGTMLDRVSFEAISHVALTRRERELLSLVAGGATARDVAARLGISPLTARKHRENLMRKLDLHSAAELAAFAVRLGLPTG